MTTGIPGGYKQEDLVRTNDSGQEEKLFFFWDQIKWEIFLMVAEKLSLQYDAQGCGSGMSVWMTKAVHDAYLREQSKYGASDVYRQRRNHLRMTGDSG